MSLRARLPRRTIRVRLTVLYSALFLASGAVLLTTTYLLTQIAVREVTVRDAGDTLVVGTDGRIEKLNDVPSRPEAPDCATTPAGCARVAAMHQRLTAQAAARRAALSRDLLAQSGAALAAMAVVSLGLGWVVAGRALRPLRRIATTTRSISATNLHRRLAIDGPDDEVKELGDTIDDLLTRLEAAFQSQRRFVANASHELRTPLARQRTVVQVALSDPHPTVDTLRAAHDTVLNATRQQERLIDALLALARSERGLDRRERVDLADLASQVVAALVPPGLRLTLRLDEARTLGDPRLVERLVANLVDNAVRYNEPGGELEVRTATVDGRARLTVTNTGPVVPGEELPRLLAPFQRLATERVHTNPGLGLGLSIVQAIATAHDAELHPTARPSGGLRVEVSFASGA